MFIAIAEEGSIHAGARRMLLAQPALSKALKSLERQLQVELVERSPQGILLTKSGEALLQQAYVIVQALARTATVVREAGNPRKSLKIGLLAGRASCSELTEEIVWGFQRSYPNVSVTVRELTFDNQFKLILNGEVDVGLVRPPSPDTEVSVTPLFSEPLMLGVRADHLLALQATVSVDDFLDLPMLDMSSAPLDWTAFWHLDDLRNGVPRTVQSVSTFSELQFALMSSDKVVMPVAQSAWRIAPDQASLRAIPIEEAPQSTAAVAVRNGEGREHVLAFREYARATTLRLIGNVPGAKLLVGSGLPPLP